MLTARAELAVERPDLSSRLRQAAPRAPLLAVAPKRARRGVAQVVQPDEPKPPVRAATRAGVLQLLVVAVETVLPV